MFNASFFFFLVEQRLDKLKCIDLRNSFNLIRTPDFTGLLRLERLYLSGCSNLVDIHPSIGQLRRLVVLDLEGCQSLTNLPSMTTEIEPLKILNPCGCKSQFIGIECLTALTTLNLKACKKLRCLPSNMDSLSSLEKLSLSRCSKLANLPENFWKIKCLKELELSWMSGLEGIWLNGIGGLSSLKCLTLRGNSFVTLPASISQLSKLEALDLWGCLNLRSLPELPSTVKYIYAQHCYNLIQTPDFTGLLRLEELYLSECSKLVEIHPSIGQLRRLVVLDLEGCQSLANFPSMTTEIEPLTILNLCGCKSQFIGIECLTALTTLNLKACEKLQCLPSNMDSLSSLEKLSLSRCSKLANLPENFWKIKCLKELELSWMYGLEGFHLNGIGGLSSLKYLTLRGNSFVTLPASISQLSKLEALDLWGCGKLLSLPELPSTVKYINAQLCYSLRRSTALLILNRYLQVISSPSLSQMVKWSIIYIYIYIYIFFCVQGHLSHESSTRKKEVGSRTEFQIIIPADRIPWWLTHQRFGNSISIELPPSWCNSKWMGFALCATLDACNPPFNVDEFGVPNETFGLTACVIALGDMPHSRYASESFFRVTDDMRRHIWVLYLSCDDWFATVWKGECSQIEVEFRTSNPKLKVRQCGVSLVYEQDVEECNQTIAQRRSNLTA
jgi:Leucine-rich repeat (LRR) protein